MESWRSIEKFAGGYLESIDPLLPLTAALVNDQTGSGKTITIRDWLKDGGYNIIWLGVEHLIVEEKISGENALNIPHPKGQLWQRSNTDEFICLNPRGRKKADLGWTTKLLCGGDCDFKDLCNYKSEITRAIKSPTWASDCHFANGFLQMYEGLREDLNRVVVFDENPLQAFDRKVEFDYGVFHVNSDFYFEFIDALDVRDTIEAKAITEFVREASSFLNSRGREPIRFNAIWERIDKYNINLEKFGLDFSEYVSNLMHNDDIIENLWFQNIITPICEILDQARFRDASFLAQTMAFKPVKGKKKNKSRLTSEEEEYGYTMDKLILYGSRIDLLRQIKSPLFVIDATGNVNLYSLLFGRKFTASSEITLPDNLKIEEVTSGAYPKKTFRHQKSSEDRVFELCKYYVFNKIKLNKTTFIVCYNDQKERLIEYLRKSGLTQSQYDDNDNLLLAADYAIDHWLHGRGTEKYKHCDCMISIGTPYQPPPVLKRRALLWGDDKRKLENILVSNELITIDDISEIDYELLINKFAEFLTEKFTFDEFIQKFGRLRAYLKSFGIDVLKVSNFNLKFKNGNFTGIPITQVLHREEFNYRNTEKKWDENDKYASHEEAF